MLILFIIHGVAFGISLASCITFYLQRTYVSFRGGPSFGGPGYGPRSQPPPGARYVLCGLNPVCSILTRQVRSVFQDSSPR